MLPPPMEVLIKSDYQGNETFENLRLNLSLSTQNNQYKKIITSKSGRKYKFFTIHNLYNDFPLEHWVLELREIIKEKDGKITKLGNDLFGGRQILPKENIRGDFMGVLYPEEKTFAYSVEGNPLYGEGMGFYFFKTIRKLEIENFCVTIKVENYKFNETDKNKLDLFEIFIEFSSACSEFNSSTFPTTE